GDRPEGICAGHDGEPEGQRYAEHPDADVGDLERQHGASAAPQHEPERSDAFGAQLPQNGFHGVSPCISTMLPARCAAVNGTKVPSRFKDPELTSTWWPAGSQRPAR